MSNQTIGLEEHGGCVCGFGSTTSLEDCGACSWKHLVRSLILKSVELTHLNIQSIGADGLVMYKNQDVLLTDSDGWMGRQSQWRSALHRKLDR